MTKTKQWILSVIFAAVLVSALFFGIMLSDPVYITASAEVTPRAAQSINLSDITVQSYISDGMMWEIGDTIGADDANVWRLSKQFKDSLATDTAHAFAQDDEFYQYARISRITVLGGPDVIQTDPISAGSYYVYVTLAENDKYEFATPESGPNTSNVFTLRMYNPEQIRLNNVSLRIPVASNGTWNFSDILQAFHDAKYLNSDPNNTVLGNPDFYEGLQIAEIRSTETGLATDGFANMQNGYYQVKLQLPENSPYVWDAEAGSDTFALTVYQNVSLANVTAELEFSENLYWQAETAEAGKNYLTPAQFRQGIVNPSQSVQQLLTEEFFAGLKIASIRNESLWNDVAAGSPVNAGFYAVTLDFIDADGLYQWADDNSNQITVEIAKKKLSLGSYENMHWTLTDGSELLSDAVYHYTYTTNGSDLQNYYSLTQLRYAPDSDWKDWTFISQIQSRNSVVRYTGATQEIQIVFGGLGALADGATFVTASGIAGMSYIPNNTRASQVSMQTASATLTLNADCNYIFDTTIDSGSVTDFVVNRGLSVSFSADGQTATVTKVWYVAANHNTLLNGDGQDEFGISDWTFGDEISVQAPVLAHGGAGYTATLINLDSGVNCYNITSAGWDSYFNRFVPAGNYQLVINVADVTDNGVSYQAHSASYFFTVAKAQLAVDESAVNAFNQTSGDFNTKLVMGSGAVDYSQLFASAENLVFGDSAYLTRQDRMQNGGHWSGQNALFDDAPVCLFRAAGMMGSDYYEASAPVWSSFFTKVDTYTVLYKITMKNYVTESESEEYEHFFYVSLCKVISEQPVLAELSFNNENQVPYLINSDADRIYYEVVAGQSFREVGTHQVNVAIKDEYKDYVMWSEDDTTGITSVTLTINPTQNFWRVNPFISNWRYGDAVPSPVGDAFYFNVANGDTKTFKYYKVDENDRLIDPDSANTSLQRFAVNGQIPIGRYALVTVITVGANGGYNGLSTMDQGYYVFEVLPSLNYWVNSPFMADITYGEYDPEINQPTATAYQYNPDLGDNIQFQYRKVGENGAIEWNTAISLTKQTPVGRYALLTTFVLGDGNQNYGAVNDGNYVVTYFNVLPTQNALVVNPVTTWQYGAYTDETATQTAKAKFFNAETDRFVYTYYKATSTGGVVVKDEASKTTDINALKVNGIVPAGFYVLELELIVEGDGSYSGITQEYTIEVTQTSNHWTEFPRIASWSVGDAQNVPQAKAAFGAANIVIRSGDTVMYTTADGWLAPCVAGYYTLEATVDGTRDYAGIPTYRTEFRVFPAINSGMVSDNTVNGANVKVEAGVVAGTEIKVSEIAQDNDAFKKVKQALESRDMTVCAGYKVEFTLNGEKITPDGRVTVTISLSDELRSKVGLAAYDANGTALGSVLNSDGTITFTTSNPENCFLAYDNNSGSTDAGFIIALVAMIILIIGLVVVAVFVIKNAQKQKAEEDDEDEEEDEEE